MPTTFSRAPNTAATLPRVLRLTACALVMSCSGPSVPDPPSPAVESADQPPAGVVLIVVDALRADHVGSYGSDQGLTPHLDELAEEGYVFENAIATSSWTRASIASMFSSRYPTAISVVGRDDSIGSSVVTVAEVLQVLGNFQTLGVSTNANAGAQYGFAQGFDTFLAPESEGSYPGDFAVPIAETVTRTALALLDERDLSRPFFLFLHYVDPHDPYLPHPGLLDSVEPSGRFDGSRRRLQEMDRTAPSDLTEADVERIKFLYAGEVKYADAWIGALLAGLRDRGLHDDTLIVVTADHGEGLWDHAPRGAPGEYGARAALPSNPALLSARRAPMIAPLRPRPPPWSSTSARRSSQVRRPIATLRSRSACHPSSISMRSTERDRRSQSVSLASRNSTLICCSLQKRVSTDRPKTSLALRMAPLTGGGVGRSVELSMPSRNARR